MCKRYVTGLLLLASLPALAQEAENETVRQVSTTQAHLQGTGAEAGPTQMKTSTMLRLMGKMLSENVKGLRVDLDPISPSAGNDGSLSLQQDPSVWHFNRRAEICYDNYRLGLQRGGMVMRYELAF
ncbi:MAG: hypothetical protein QM749_02650 [Aquabacterium sp.]